MMTAHRQCPFRTFCRQTQAYFVLDEVFLGGVLLETSANVMEKKLEAQERMMDAAKAGLIDS